MKKIILVLMIVVFIMPLVTNAAGLVPCGGPGDKYEKCNFDALITMINGLINFLLFKITLPIAAILFVWIGFLLLFSGGDEGKKKQAKTIAWNLVVGVIIALAAWLIVKTILVGLGLCSNYALLENFVGRDCSKVTP